MIRPRVLLAVHGGAGRLAKRNTLYPGRRKYELGLVGALRAGQQVLIQGGSAVRAVAAAVTVLEDDESFNAGKGAALCADGSVELSASMMSGRDRSVGAVVGLKRIRNPILAAQSLMRHRHGLLFGQQADAFAEKAGLEIANFEYFFTKRRLRQWQRMQGTDQVTLDHNEEESAHGTVGAVACDRRGNLAAATSTGGLVNQLRGRVGDTPVVGAGTWADNHVCAVSATGEGDAFARVAFARRLADLIELSGLTLEEATDSALDEVARVKGRGGCIAVNASGNLICRFSTPQMLRGWVVDNNLPTVGILPNEEIIHDASPGNG